MNGVPSLTMSTIQGVNGEGSGIHGAHSAAPDLAQAIGITDMEMKSRKPEIALIVR